jgi:hypothetical protein
LSTALTVPPIVKPVNVPTLVSEEAVTPLANVAPLNVPAAAVTVMSALPLKLTPLMLRAVANVAAVVAVVAVDGVISTHADPVS